MSLHTLTIAQFRKKMSLSGICYQDDVFISDRMTDIEQFMTPCRIDAITVLICVGGEIEGSINLNEYHIKPGMIVINFPSNIIHIKSVTDLKAYTVMISTDFLSKLQIDFKKRADFFLKMQQNAVCQLSRDTLTSLSPYYNLLSDCIKSNFGYREKIICGLVQALSYTLFSLLDKYNENANTDIPEINHGKAVFNKFMELIHQNRSRIRGVKFYADKLCLTPNYLSCIIKNYTGKPATEWINKCVILEAKILLQNSELNIQDIAYELNFPSQSAFGKYFRQRVGVSPKKYRLMQNKK